MSRLRLQTPRARRLLQWPGSGKKIRQTEEANTRHRGAAACHRHHFTFRLAAVELCTDNAGMIALLAERKVFHNVKPTSLDADILPAWSLENSRT